MAKNVAYRVLVPSRGVIKIFIKERKGTEKKRDRERERGREAEREKKTES